MEVTAAVLRDIEAPYSIEQLQLDEPRAGEVLVCIAGAGMCHTDMLARSPGSAWPKPIVLGHEGSGIVERVGAGVTKVQPGDTVVLSYASCGGCLNCLQGAPQYCDLLSALNFAGSRLDGSSPLATLDGDRVAGCFFGQSSFATHALASERNVVKIDSSGIQLELLGPLGCGVQTGAGAVVNSLALRTGQSIAIFGCGAVGLAAVMAAKVVGASTIIGVDLHQHRLDLAIELGCSHVVNAEHEPDVAAAIRVATGGGVNASLDTTAVPSVVRQAVGVLLPRGTACLVGAGMQQIVLDGSGFLMGKTVKGVIEGDAVPDQFIPLMLTWYREGRFPFHKLITRYTLDQIDQAQTDCETGAAIKPVFVF